MKMNLRSWAAIVLLVLISWDQSPKFAFADLIEDTCKKTSDAKLCLSVLRSDPRSATADVIGLIQIVLEHLKAYVQDTLALAKKLFEQEKNPSVKEDLRICVDQYDLGVSTVDEVMETVKSKKFGLAHDEAYRVVDDASTCDDAVAGTPLTSRNSAVTNLTILAMDVIQILV